ncbi:MAG: putative transcriptional regulator [Candidatus Azotimanducaceae bacterium]|jgi:putative transcriptional regulator
MTAQLHPETDLLVDYSAGSLSPALCVSVTAHLHFCAKCRAQQDKLLDIGGDLLHKIEPADMPETALASAMSRILDFDDSDVNGDTDLLTSPLSQGDEVISEDVAKLPSFLNNLVPNPQFNKLTRSLEVAKIAVGEDKYELALHKIRAGGHTPKHDHKGLEVTVVLYGSFSDQDGVYNEGDFIVRQPGDVHSPLASLDDECICLSVVEAPIRLVGPLLRMINPFLRFSPA